MSQLAVSTFSLREQLGPLKFDFKGPNGDDVAVDLPYPKLLDLADFPERAKEEFGVEAIETVAFQFNSLDNPELNRFGASLRSAGIELLNVAIDFGDLLGSDTKRRHADIGLLKQWIDRFAPMGPRFIRINPGSASHPQGEGTPPRYLIEALAELSQHTKACGSRLLVENHGGPSSNPQWMTALLDAVGRENLGLLLDLGNFEVLTQPVMAAVFGNAEGGIARVVETLDLNPLYDAIAQLAPRAELVHLKVHEVDANGTILAVDLERALKILADNDYAGSLTVEYEGTGGDPWEKTRRVVDAARSIVPKLASATDNVSRN